MRLVLFTPPTTLPNEHAVLHSLAARAKITSNDSFLPTALHVRKPGVDEASVEAYLKELPHALLERAVLHSHHALASKFDIQGIHFTEAARNALGGKPQRPRGALRSHALTLSTSLHSCAEVEAEAARSAAARRGEEKAAPSASSSAPSACCCYDYVFLSPVFESISKPGYGGKGTDDASPSAQFWDSDEGPSLALTAALTLARESRLGVVALGGVDSSSLDVVGGLGFEAAAVLGAVWANKDPVEAWAEVLKAAAA